MVAHQGGIGKQLPKENAESVFKVIEGLDKGLIRVAGWDDSAQSWVTHVWVKQAILLYFSLTQVTEMIRDPFCFRDKIPLKQDFSGVRAVPGSVVRYGAHVEPGAILMPSFVNIGARVGAGTMVDTWATVGSCAHIGRNVHLAGGVGIGGVLEPPSATPVIIEDDVFVGSRVVIVEGVHVKKAAIIGAGVVLTASTVILDMRGSHVVESRGVVPERAVVIPGVRQKKFPAGEMGVPCALIIAERTDSTDRKVSLNEALREHAVPV